MSAPPPMPVSPMTQPTTSPAAAISHCILAHFLDRINQQSIGLDRGRQRRPRGETRARITAKADDAVRAALERAGAQDQGPANGEDRARSQDIPQNFPTNMLSELRHAGIVRT